jgi:hypothetical protein
VFAGVVIKEYDPFDPNGPGVPEPEGPPPPTVTEYDVSRATG